MFENIYGLSCVENQVLAQLKLYGMDISKLYGATFTSFEELFFHMVMKDEKPEHFCIAPRIQDVLKRLGVISLELKKTELFNSHFSDTNKLLVRVKPDFVKQKLFARGFRIDHYVLVEKDNDKYTLYNDIPEIIVSLSEAEFESIYDGEYFVLKILRDLSKTDLLRFNCNDQSMQNNDLCFPLQVKDIERIENMGLKVRNFFWIYKTILYRMTEYYKSFLDINKIEEKRNLSENMFARAEYFNLKKTTDVSNYISLINEAYESEIELLQLLRTGASNKNE